VKSSGDISGDMFTFFPLSVITNRYAELQDERSNDGDTFPEGRPGSAGPPSAIDPKDIDIAGYVRVAVGNDLTASRDSLRRQVARYASNPFYRNFFAETGFDKEMSDAAAALAEGNLDKAADSITVEMQDQVAVVGTVAECQAALEKRRDAGLQMPVIAPFAVGDNMASHMHVINALAPKG